ncbi:hypothetical protein C8R31_10422 [Nitrosospira sp. Nsp2]|nr:hypothetical protein C8R31_10422 [Nitrosospira sp. Nsp2]
MTAIVTERKGLDARVTDSIIAGWKQVPAQRTAFLQP